MSLYNVPSMVVLGVAGNDDITGTLEGIENLVNLQELYVGETGMSGPLPEGLGALTKMKFIKSSQAAFTGALPASIGNLVDLEELDFSLNSLDGELPEELGQLTKLEKVALHGNGECNIYICVVIYIVCIVIIYNLHLTFHAKPLQPLLVLYPNRLVIGLMLLRLT